MRARKRNTHGVARPCAYGNLSGGGFSVLLTAQLPPRLGIQGYILTDQAQLGLAYPNE